MSDMDRIYAAIARAARDANRRLPAEKRIDETTDAILMGDSARLDSLGLITLLVAVEQEIENEFRIQINLIDDADELAEKNGAFRTVSALAKQVSALLAAGEGRATSPL